MAACRHGGYRDYDRRDGELDLEVSRTKEYYLSRFRGLDHGNSVRRIDIRDNGRDLKKRDFSNGYTRNYGYSHNHHHSQKRRSADREPGELSSDDSDSRRETLESKQNGIVLNRENEEMILSPSKKRKLSPTVWDGEHSEKQQGSTITDDSPRDLLMNGDAEPEQIHEQDGDYYLTTKNLSSSRWADSEEIESPVPKKKKKSVSPVERESSKKTPTPELGEVVMGGNSVGSRSGSGSTGSEREEEDDEYMEIDREDRENNFSESDSDPDDLIRDETPEPVKPTQRCINMLQGCRSVDEFERLNKINEGTYGVVYRARDKKTGEIVALKKVKMEKEKEGFPLTSLREINILLSFHHPAIVDVKEVVVGSSLDSIFMVMEYMEHDLKGVMETMKQPYSQSEVKCLMLQLLEGVKYLHDNWVLHRDLKTSNLLLNNCGELKICDFGLSRQYGYPLKPYTQLVVTLWYRAPELLLGAKEYSTAIDMWSLGCIMAELLSKEPVFCGKTEVDQLDKIFKRLGTPNEKIWPGFTKLPGAKVNFVKQPYNKLREMFPATSFSGRPTLSEAGFDLLNKLLTYDPEKRITAEDALKHPWFREVPLPKSKDFMPTFPAHNEQDRRIGRVMKSPDPLEAQRLKESRGLFLFG